MQEEHIEPKVGVLEARCRAYIKEKQVSSPKRRCEKS